MKKQLLKVGIIAFISAFSASFSAQDIVERKVMNENGTVTMVVFKPNAGQTLASVPALFRDVLNLKSHEELKLVNSTTDFTGNFVDEKYQLYSNNIKVEGGVYNLHFKDGTLLSMNGEMYSDAVAPTRPGISEASAFDAAMKSVGAQKYMWEDAEYIANNPYKKPHGELVYFPFVQDQGKTSLMLVYKFDIYAAQPISRDYIYVDAMTGRIAAVDPIMKHARDGKSQRNSGEILTATAQSGTFQVPFLPLVTGTADTRYSGTQSIETTLSGANYILHDTTRGGGVRTYNLKKSTSLSSAVDFTDNNNAWTAAEFNNTNFDNAALDAHWGVEKTYDYFLSTFGRNSYDNLGTLLRSYVHYGSSYENAGWTGSEMIYGDGASMFSPLTAFDVTAHELGHGVCSSTAKLLYQRESGALNEGFSDIWGAAAEAKYAPTKQTWLIGEDITKISPGYLRSMSNPKSGNPPQPDTYHGTNWYPATVAEGCVTPNSNTNDNCGVHYNSGVLNHWFYILSQGKTGVNDIGHNYNVTGITLAKAEKIAYRLETNYLGTNSTFMDARNFGIQAAKDLYGADTPEAIATQDAFYAVGLGAKYLAIPDTTAPSSPSALLAKNTTGTQTVLEWSPATDENGIDRYIIFKNGVQTATVFGNVLSYIATGLTPNTTYNFYVKAQDPYDNISSASNDVDVTTMNVPLYCTATSNNTNDERIKRVQIGTIDNTSTSLAGYEDFSYLSTDVTKGQIYSITITPEWTSTQYNEGYAVFVDWNNDGDFLDANETAYTRSPSVTNPVVGTITVPTAVSYIGTVRMRVIMRYNNIPTSGCGSIPYGQVEDYSLNVQNILGVANNESVATVLYPNPVKDIITIQSKTAGEFAYKIFNTAGQIVGKGSSVDKKVNAEHIPVGNYMIELVDKSGTKSVIKFIKK